MTSIAKSIVGAYMGIGACLLACQFVSARYEPHCTGIARHSLLERAFPRTTQLEELERTLKGGPRQHGLLTVGLQVARWLPDLYSEVVTGPMSVSDYLRGGFTCAPVKAQLRPHA